MLRLLSTVLLLLSTATPLLAHVVATTVIRE
jgi:hypothetical protein